MNHQISRVVCILLYTLVLHILALSQSAVGQAANDVSAQDHLAQAKMHIERAELLEQQKKTADALASLKEAQAKLAKVQGEPLALGKSQLRVANLLLTLGQREDALKLLSEVEKLAERQPDDKDWRRIRFRRLEAITFAQADVWDYSGVKQTTERLLELQAQSGELGTAETAKLYAKLGHALSVIGRPQEALAAKEKAAETHKQVSGESSLDYVDALNEVASQFIDLEKFTPALEKLQKAEHLARQHGKEGIPHRAAILQTYGALYDDLGDTAKSQVALDESLKLLETGVKENDPRLHRALSRQLAYASSQGRFEHGEQMGKRWLNLLEATYGPESEEVAVAESNLASLYANWLKLDQALELQTKAGKTLEKTSGKRSWHYANYLGRMAVIHSQKRQSVEAIKLFTEAAQLHEEMGNLSQVSHNLLCASFLAISCGEWGQAETMFQRNADVERRRFGELHSAYLLPHRALAMVKLVRRDFHGAAELQQQAIELQRRQLLAAAASLSERQHLDLANELRGALDLYLNVTPYLEGDAAIPDAKVYQHVLAAKGIVFQRQRLAASFLSEPGQEGKLQEFKAVSGELSAIMLQKTSPLSGRERDAELERLTAAKERLETELAVKNPAFRRELMTEQLTVEKLQSLLPDDVTIVDFLEYDWINFGAHNPGEAVSIDKALSAWEPHLAAFIVRKSQPVQRLELGSVRKIASARNRWKPESRLKLNDDRRAAGHELRKLVWEPITKHLRSEGLVLISPDGVTARIPFAALPGNKVGTNLLDEHAVAMIPVPQLLPAMIADPHKGKPAADDQLLLVGDVDFNSMNPEKPQESKLAATTGSFFRALSGGKEYKPLAGTKREIETIGGSWRKVSPKPAIVHAGSLASEERFRQEVVGATYVHLATHGFFKDEPAPVVATQPAVMRVLVGVSPTFRYQASLLAASPPIDGGLKTGLVFAGANSTSKKEATNDGLLTAADVATLRMNRTRLVVLSACDTAQGNQARGEGILGLQRAFQTAGAESVLATLWKIPDGATGKLMERFYDNLWNKELSRAESLREAQQWLRKEANRDPVALRAGLELLPEDEIEAGELSPFWWGAFVLSGDWR